MLTFLEWLSESVKKLKSIYDKDRLRQLSKVISFMPSRKINHSLRVGATAAEAGLQRKYVDAAILHDYLERGGNPGLLDKLGLGDRALKIIRLLSIEEKTPGMDDNDLVFQHVASMLSDDSIDQKTKDIAIIIKASDRLDNIQRRINASKLTELYWRKSLKLLELLMSNYQGPKRWVRYIDRKLFRQKGQVDEFGFYNNSLKKT